MEKSNLHAQDEHASVEKLSTARGNQGRNTRTRTIVPGALMGSHLVTTGAISNHQGIPPHRMIMAATDPITIDRSTIGTIPATSSALPMLPMALEIHAHTPLPQTLLIGKTTTIHAHTMTTRVLANNGSMVTHILAGSASMESVHQVQELGQIIAVIAVARGTETIGSRVKTEEEITDAPILSATSAHSHMSATDQEDTITSVPALTRAIPAGRVETGHGKLHQKNGKSIHPVHPTTNSLRVITNASITIRALRNSVTPLIKGTIQKVQLTRTGHDVNTKKRALHRSVMSPACQTVASSRVHAQFNARKPVSGQRSPTIPKTLSDPSRWRRKR
jgi:hypothetical protein